ncbi:MAG: hypothetical protein WCP89_02710, partial [archaeon]
AVGRVNFFAEYTWVLVVLSLAISVLGIRWIGGSDIVQTIILPYSTLAIAIGAGIPFVLYFFIVKDFHKTARNVAWIFFGVIFIGIWISRVDQVGDAGWIYIATAALSLVMILFDGAIRKMMLKMDIERSGTANAEEAILKYKLRISELPTLLAAGAITAAEKTKLEKQYRKMIFDLSRRS